MSVHEDCEYYVPENDMCLAYYQLGFHNVSQYDKCVKTKLWGNNEDD